MVVRGNPPFQETHNLEIHPFFSAYFSTWVLPRFSVPPKLRCQASERRKRLSTPSFRIFRFGKVWKRLELGKKSSAYLRELTGWIQDITNYCIYMFLWLEMCIYASVEKQVSYVYCLLLIIPNKSHAMISLFWSSNSWMHETCFRIISKQLQNGSDVHFGSECITNITKLLFSEWCSKSRLTCLAMAHAQRIDL